MNVSRDDRLLNELLEMWWCHRGVSR